MNIKKNDTVYIRSGKNKGQTGKVLKAFPKLQKVLVEGMNIKKRHEKSGKSEGKGQIIERSHPVPVSSVSLIDPKTKKPTRIGMKMVGNKMVRVSKKSGAEF